MAETPARWSPVSLRTSFLQLVGLTAFAVAQPLFDILGRHIEFLVAHRAGPVEILLLVLGATLALPTVLVACEALAGLIHRHVRSGLGLVFRWFLLLLIVLPPLHAVTFLGGIGALSAAALLAAAGVRVFLRFDPVRKHLAILALAAPLFCLLFLGQPSVRQQLRPAKQHAPADQPANNLTPVVFVIFDELPVTALLDHERRIDPVLYPNFAALAGEAAWYPNATTVSGATPRSIAASMTGLHPRHKTPATLDNYPDNLFTYLNGSHRFVVEDAQTQLCPDHLRLDATSKSSRRLRMLAFDTAVIYLNIVLPESFAAYHAELDNRWTGFAAGNDPAPAGPRINRFQRFERFLASLEAGDRPLFGFMHILLPHNPYQKLPSGTVYNYRPGVPKAENKRWATDELVVLHSYRRSLLQLQYVDSLLGRLIAQLKKIGQYDSTLLVITSDHGASYRPGKFHRAISDENLADVMSVPLLIKLPEQRTGRIDDRYVQSIDVLPTILEALEVESPAPYDGQSLLNPDRYEPRAVRFEIFEEPVPREKLAERFEQLAWKLAAFGPGGDPEALYEYETFHTLIGERPEPFAAGEDPQIVYRLDEPERYRKVRRDRRFVPAEITGTLRRVDGFAATVDIAVAINGTIAAVTTSYQAPVGSRQVSWCALARESAVATGRNQLTLFRIEVTDDEIRLYELAEDSR